MKEERMSEGHTAGLPAAQELGENESEYLDLTKDKLQPAEKLQQVETSVEGQCREKRKELIRAIETKRNSKVITYITGDRFNLQTLITSDVVSILHEQILSIQPEKRNKLDLLIYSRGGESDVPWSVVSMFREYCQEGSFSVLIPYRAHSAATVIALGADEIVMTKKAELGPIDITIQNGPYNPTEGEDRQRLPVSVEDVMGYFSLLEKVGCERPDEKMKGFEQLTSHVHPLVLGTVYRLLEQTKLVALRLLSTRAKAFSEERNRDIVKRLSSEIYSHRHTISRTEAISYLGLEQVVKAEDLEIADEMWQLYSEYRDMFALEDPFRPEEHLIANDLDEYTWEGLNLACIESMTRFNVCRKDIKLRRLRQVPPQLTLNLNNLVFPPVNIPSTTTNMTPQQIAQAIEQILPAIVQPIIKQAAAEAAELFRKSLPSAQFERTDYNGGWHTEE